MQLEAKQTPRDQTVSGWFDIAPKRETKPSLDKNIDTDWLIIGAGIAGLSAAYRLKQLTTESITLIDAQAVGWGAAGRNSGFMIDLPHDIQSDHYAGSLEKDIKKIKANRATIAYAKEMVDAYSLEHCFKQSGKYHAAANEKGLVALRQFQQHLDNLGESYTPLDQQEFKAVTGSDYYLGGLFTPGCVMIQPAQFMQNLADGLTNEIGSTVSLYENTPAISIQTGDSHTVTTSKGTIRCKRLIMANNGHLESFGLYKRRLMHIHLFGSMTRELSSSEQALLGGDPEWGIIPALPMGSTVRRYANRIIVRNHIAYTPNQTESKQDNTRSARRHLHSFQRRFPMLEKVKMQSHWAGALCLSLNSAPAFGEVEKGVYAAGCQNGLGLTLGTLNGKLIAEHACGIDSAELRETLNGAQPKRIYPEPFMSIGAKTHLWWGQRKAGLDL